MKRPVLRVLANEVARRFHRREIEMLAPHEVAFVPGSIEQKREGGFIITMIDGSGRDVEHVHLDAEENVVTRTLIVPRRKPGLAPNPVKDTNPKDVQGIKKASFACVPMPVLGELGLAMLEGSLKYGRHNYRSAGVRAEVYVDAAFRHLTAWWEGEDNDPDVRGAQLSHLVKAMACLTVLRDAMIQGKLNDDRPPRSPAGWMQALNEQANAMRAAYPEPKAPFTHKTGPHAHQDHQDEGLHQPHRLDDRPPTPRRRGRGGPKR